MRGEQERSDDGAARNLPFSHRKTGGVTSGDKGLGLGLVLESGLGSRNPFSSSKSMKGT